MNLKTDYSYYRGYRILFAVFILISWIWDFPFATETYNKGVWVYYLIPLWALPFCFGWKQEKMALAGAASFILLGMLSPEMRSPEIPFILFQLFIWALMPVISPNNKIESKAIQTYAWFFGLAHISAGIGKLFSADNSWLKGNALGLLARTSAWVHSIAADILLRTPALLLTSFTYVALIMEILGGILIIIPKTRSLGVYFLLLLHLSSAFIFNLPQVSLGILMSLFFFKESFLKESR